MQVTKSLFRKAPEVGDRVYGTIHGYSSVRSRTLLGSLTQEQFDQIEKSGGLGQTSARLIHSEDDGQTWKQQEPVSTTRETNEGMVYEAILSTILDAPNDICFFFYLRRWIKDPANAWRDIKKFQRLLYRISRDGGKTWEHEQIFVQKGPEYDETHYARGIRFGYNGGFICNKPIQLKNGTILAPFFMWPWDEKQKKADHARKNCAVLAGTWDSNLSRIEWELGDYTRITDESGCLDEITLAELEGGSILGILRASPRTGSAQFYVVSPDGGRTWSHPQRVIYDNGEPFYCPCSISRLIRSSRNGKLYWIANIQPFREDLYASIPNFLRRGILQIAEVNEENYGIKKQTLTPIDRVKDGELPRKYSNFGVYEDRDTGNFVLTMCQECCLPLKARTAAHPAGYQGPYLTKETYTAHSYKYEIQL